MQATAQGRTTRTSLPLPLFILASVVGMCLPQPGMSAEARTQSRWLAVEDGQPGRSVTVSIESQSDRAIELALRLPGAALSEVTGGDGRTYTQLRARGCGATADRTGLPMMPFKGFFLEIPYGVDVHVDVLESASHSLGAGFRIWPVQPPVPRHDSIERPAFQVDEAAYAKDAFFPPAPVAVDEPAVIRGRRVIFVRAFPFQYNPATTELRAVKSLRFAVKFEGAPDGASNLRRTRLATRESDALAKRLLLNYEPAAPKPSDAMLKLSTGDAADYLIIVADQLENAIQPLAEWKHRKGLITRVVKMSDVGVKDDDVKDYIQNAYDTWTPAPSYVLLVGDFEDVPTDLFFVFLFPYYCYTDHPYSCVDGSDHYPDLTLGRLPVSDEPNCVAIVNKILAYDRTPDAGQWYDGYLTASYFEDDDNDGYEDMLFIENASYL